MYTTLRENSSLRDIKYMEPSMESSFDMLSHLEIHGLGFPHFLFPCLKPSTIFFLNTKYMH